MILLNGDLELRKCTANISFFSYYFLVSFRSNFLTKNSMCTLTFIPKGNFDFIITSNRDEASFRKTLPPKTYVVDGEKLVYPKDEVAGGTWIGVSSRNRLVCLLNGGFIAHER